MADLGPDELRKLEAVEKLIVQIRSDLDAPPPIFGAQASDKVASIVGSWKFLLGQGFLLFLYITGQLFFLKDGFDPYPFILLNLMLSFQAAFTAPIILMAQNRSDAKERRHARKAYRTIGHIEELMKSFAEESQPLEPEGDENGSS